MKKFNVLTKYQDPINVVLSYGDEYEVEKFFRTIDKNQHKNYIVQPAFTYQYFEESNRRFLTSDFKKKINSLCLWEFVHEDMTFKLECWNHVEFGSVIVQLWPNGNGFHTYTG